MQKEINLTISRLDDNGRGIGIYEGIVVFVPHTLVGEKVKVTIIEEKKKYWVGKVKQILKSSDRREKPRCPYYFTCGGCDLQHFSYEDTISYKEKMLMQLFQRNQLYQGPIEVLKNPTPFFYRNKITLKVENGTLGFYQKKSHHFLEIKHCYLANETINQVIQDFSFFHFSNGDLTIRTNYNQEILLDITTEDELQIETALTEKYKIAGIIHNGICVYGNSYFFERINHVLYQVSYNSFFQVNPFVSELLFRYLQEEASTSKKVLDLYCGVGTLGLQVSSTAEVLFGIEVVSNAVLNAISNAKLNKIKNASYHLGDVEKIIEKINETFDLILIDPPRSGMDKKTIEVLKKSQASTLIYVSCNPQTLVRDLKELTDTYNLKSVKGFDMFSFSSHIETVCVLKRR